jgi:hypothetical protein
MIDWFVGYALGKRQVMAMVWAFVSIYGHCSWTQLAIEAYPDNPDASSQAIAQVPGMRPKRVESSPSRSRLSASSTQRRAPTVYFVIERLAPRFGEAGARER